jgi:hypothetical protein
MKTLTALIIALAGLSTVHALENDANAPITVQLPATEAITIALADETFPTGGKCKAVCMLPGSRD